MAAGKKSQLVLTYDHDTATAAIGGQVENFDLAMNICDTAKREFGYRLGVARAGANLKIDPSMALPFLKRPQG